MPEYIKISEFRKAASLAAQAPEAMVKCMDKDTLVRHPRPEFASHLTISHCE
jgi:hypothetical protein